MKHNSTIKEQSLNPQLSGRSQTQAVQDIENLDDRILVALQAAGEKKAIDIVVLDLREIASFTCPGNVEKGCNFNVPSAPETLTRSRVRGTTSIG